MKVNLCVLAAIAVATLPASARADDPHDPTMRSSDARAHDREIIRQLNRKELEAVRERDARYAKGWRDWRSWHEAQPRQEYSSRLKDYDREKAEYAQRRATYEREMAEWRRNVQACRSGDYSACDN